MGEDKKRRKHYSTMHETLTIQSGKNRKQSSYGRVLALFLFHSSLEQEQVF